MRLAWVTLLLIGIVVLLPGHAAEANHSTFAPGDLFISLSTGQVQWRHPDGTLNRVLTGVMPGRAGGMAFDAAGNLYVTHWCDGSPNVAVCATGNGVEVFDPMGIPRGPFGSGYNCNPYSLRFDGAGNLYVGQADCTGDILKFDAGGTLQAAYDVATDRGSSWIELAPDGCTVFYTSGGPTVKRFDMCRHSPLADFYTAPPPDSSAKVLRMLPDGSMLLTVVSAIVRLDPLGNVVQTYDVPGELRAWAWLDLVGDGTFWVTNHASSNVYQFDIATGQLLAGFNASPASMTVIGLAVKPGPGAGASSGTFAPGDVFVSLATGEVQWRRPDGTLNAVLAGLMPGRAGGMAFDAAGSLYVTHWCEGSGYVAVCPSGGGVEVFSASGFLVGAFGSGYNCNPSSIRLDAAGNVYVGQSDCAADVLGFDRLGTAQAAYDVATEERGSDGIELAADGCTILYTSRSANVKRFDVCARTQLPDFNTAPLPGPAAYAVRVLPDGGVLVADVSAVVRLDASGNLVQTYGVPGEPQAWEWLDLVGDGTFWASNHYSSNLYRFDIATGQVLASFNASPTSFTVMAVAVKP
jgi:outer membrane protein assembly factor BamB